MYKFTFIFYCLLLFGSLSAQEILVSSVEQQKSYLQLKEWTTSYVPPTADLPSFIKPFTYKQGFEFRLKNDLQQAYTCYLQLGTENIFKYSSIDVVRSVRGMVGIMILEVVETKELFYNGYLTPISYRQYPNNLQVLSYRLAPQKTYTFRLHVFDLVKGVSQEVKLMSGSSFVNFQENFIKETNKSAIISDLYVGAILVMIVFVLAIYSQNKMRDFAWYALYLLAMLFFGILDMYPLNFRGFIGWQFPKVFIYLKESTVYLYLIFYHLFLNDFLQAKNNQITLHKGLIGANYLYAFLLIFNLIAILFFFEAAFIRQLTWVNTYVFYGSILFYIYLFVMIWKLKNIPFSRYIFWGSFIFYCSNVMAIYLNANYTNHKDIFSMFGIYPNNYIQIGAVVEVLFFAVALGRKALLDSEEKNKLQKQVIKQLEEKKQLIQGINERLEKEVAEKTEEILSQAQSLQAEKEEKMRLQFGKQLQEMRLYAIQTQLNPHFLFNCLNTIKSLVLAGENEKASVYLNQFARLMRSTLENSEKLRINLKESMEYLKNYVEMEKLRFKEDFDFEISFEGEEDPELLQVPPMLIQPFVENAIIHGLLPSKKYKRLEIEFVEEDDFLICKVKDNGLGFDAKPQHKTHQSKGLKMIQTYFDLWNVQKNDKASFVISSQLYFGTEVQISIPI